MKHIVFFFLILCYSLGVLSLAVLSLAYIKSKARTILFWVLYLLTGTSQLVFMAFLEYQYANLHYNWFNGHYNIIYYSLQSVSIVALPRLCGELFPSRRTKWINAIFNGLFSISVAIILVLCFTRIPNRWEAIDALPGIVLFHLILLTAVVYTVLVFTFKSRRIDDPTEKNFCFCFPVYLGLVTLLDGVKLIKTFPEVLILPALCYLGWNFLLIRYSFKRYFKNDARTPEESVEQAITELEISGREKEIISLLALGSLNKDIAAQLFISESTVKKHIQNIYKKLGVKNKVQLFNLIKGKEINP